MPPTIAVAHYPEGAGHATRMLAVADAIEDAGGRVRMAGGGAGRQFVALNGYDAFEPTNVDFIDTYQGGSLWGTARRSLPASLARIADYQAWLSETEPDALVTDDMFAAMAASRCDVPQYVLKHDMPALYDDVIERAGAGVHTLFQLSAAREFFYPVVWPGSDVDPADATRIPPVALDGEPTVDADPDVVVVPSHYSSLSRIADHLRRQGYDVLDVADDDWEAVPSLLPYIRRADAVVCSGYSTIMDAAVAGTPCVVHPATDEQDAVADCLERHEVTGFTIAPEPIDVLDAVDDPPDAPEFDNGADAIARRVLTDLHDPDPYASEAEPDPAADAADPSASRLRVAATAPTLLAACAIATGSFVAPRRLGRRAGSAAGRVRAAAWTAGAVVGGAGLAAGSRCSTAALAGGDRLGSGARSAGARVRSGVGRIRSGASRIRPTAARTGRTVRSTARTAGSAAREGASTLVGACGRALGRFRRAASTPF